jgi:glycosyltransferase involved in cell wall biosynthesis
MEIAFFTDSYDPMRDGVASVTGGLARTVARMGHSVRVFAPDATIGVPSHDEMVDGVRVRRIRSLPVPLYSQYRWPVFPFSLIRAAQGVRDADVVHLHTPGPIGSMGFLSARRFHRPLVGTFHTNIREMRESVPRKFLVPLFFRVAWWYNLGTYWRCDVATAPSASAGETLERSARKPFRRPVEVVPNGIDIEKFRPGCRVPDWRARCGLPSVPLLTYLGRLTVDKGVHRFLDAVATVAQSEEIGAIVGGTGPEEAAVRERIARDPLLAARVRYVGPVAEPEKAALLGQTDVFVLPSTSDTASVALLEAMACGAMVVAPSCGGAAEVVDDGITGRRVDVLAPDQFAAALRHLVRETEERRRIAAEGARWVRGNASLEAMARRFISLYRMLAEERSPHGERFPS